MRFGFVLEEKARYPVRVLCRVLEVSKSGFYAWCKRDESDRSKADRALVVEMKAVHAESRRTYGSPRIHAELRELGRHVSRKRVARLMKRHGIRPKQKRKFRTTTDSSHALPVAENILDREFDVDEPNRAWASDITYVLTKEGWLYLCVILDLFSRRVVGWAAGARIDGELAERALLMALHRRAPSGGLLFHSDRGSQYAANEFQRILIENGVQCSMSRKGNCWDNAVAESFFATLKTELVHDADFTTRNEALRAIFDFIELFYNRTRRHSALGYLSPADYETMVVKKRRAA